MSEATTKELLELTQRLLDAIADGDWDVYRQLCDATLSAFEPEARGHLVEGMGFHRFYFDQQTSTESVQTTVVAPHVRLLGNDVAVVCYNRLIQMIGESGKPATLCFEETRVWQRQEQQWRHVHFHRSIGS